MKSVALLLALLITAAWIALAGESFGEFLGVEHRVQRAITWSTFGLAAAAWMLRSILWVRERTAARKATREDVS